MKTGGRVLILSVAVALMVNNGIAQERKVTWPNTPVSKLFQEWMGLCAAPNAAVIEKWSADHYVSRFLERISAKDIANHDVQECTENGGYQALKIVDEKPDAIRVLVEGVKSGAYRELGLRMIDQKVGPREGRPATLPEELLPKDLSDAALQKTVQSYLAKLGTQQMASGIVVVARGAQPIATATTGYADRAKKTPFTSSTQFTIGSMGKMFTAAGIGQLVDQGKISYDDKVGKFFPEYPNQAVRDKVTVGMLLSHRSGMGDFLSKRTPEMMKNGVKRADEFMPLYDKDEPKFEPGTDSSYSNAGLALAGAILEKVSGEAYPDYIRKHIFDPAGMKNSDPNNIPHSDPRMVTPYTKVTEHGPASEWSEAEHDVGSPAGGAISTAEDLVRFADALRSGKLVSAATLKTMAESHTDTPGGGHYGYAMEIENMYGKTVVGHSGGFPGVNTRLFIVLDSSYTVVSLSNQDPPAAEFAGRYAASLAAEKGKQSK